MEKAMFGAGCFWGVEEAFRRVEGVARTAVGYSGGEKEEPAYREVCSGRTGHAEVVYLEFEPEKVTYRELLDLFWRIHDPCTLNRQGPDVGTQYRSAIYFFSPEQESAARTSRSEEEAPGRHRGSIVTEITPASRFWMGEDYHQQYLEKRGIALCH